MKQQKTTVLFALLTAVSFVLGHASVTVKDGWEEPVVVWLAVALKTGIFPTFTNSVLLYITAIYTRLIYRENKSGLN